MYRRAAATLIEVLVAIFVMGIGLIALLALFPIGAISMAQAIQDERTYQAALIANGYANALDLRHDPWVIRDWPLVAPPAPAAGPNGAGVAWSNPPTPYPKGNLGGNDSLAVLDAYTNPSPGNFPDAVPTGPSYPLFIDPVGYYSSLQPNWVGGTAGPGLPGVLARRRVSFVPQNPAGGTLSLTQTQANPYLPSLVNAAGTPTLTPSFPPGAPISQFLPSPPYPANTPVPIYAPGVTTVPQYPQPYPYPPYGTGEATTSVLLARMFTLWDDLSYDPQNLGYSAMAGANIIRDTRYSWAFVCQRPQNGITMQNSASNGNAATTANTAVVNLSIVIFSKRPLALTTNLSLPEYVYDVNQGNPTYYDPINNLITIDYTNQVPPPVRPGDWILDVTRGTTIPAAGSIYTPHGYFYRAVSVNEFQDTMGGTPRSFAQYEVQTPLRGFTDNLGNVIFPAPGGAAQLTDSGTRLGYAGTSVVMDGVVRVYEMGPGRAR